MNKLAESIEAKRELAYRKARRSFWSYAQLKAPDFYKKDRTYLKEIANEMQEFYESSDDVLIMNIPPRHGKSRTAGLFVEWALGQNPKHKVMTGSYNELLSTNFSRSVRNSIAEQKGDELITIYNDIFPHTKVNQNHSSVSLWGLEGEPHSYLATSPGGTATGFGANILIIDDLIKNASEAFNSRTLSDHWDWFTQTMLSRLEEGGKIIIVMTRWHNDDLAGRALKHFRSGSQSVRLLKMKALQDDGTMLSDDVLSKESYLNRIRSMGNEIALANYQQEPIDVKGRLYTSFKTYEHIPETIVKRATYVDTADTGSDNLAVIIYDQTNVNEGYVVDVIYTKEAMEVTEPLLASKLYEHQVNEVVVESNAGGRGFGRSVERILNQEYKSNTTKFIYHHQSKNKVSRILSNSTWVMDNIYMPINWSDRWSDAFNSLTTYQKEGKNEHDDIEDCITGVAEMIQLSGYGKSKSGKYKALQSLGL